MAKAQPAEEEAPAPLPLVWLSGEIKTPPFTAQGRQEAGISLRLLQQGEHLGMPQAEPLPDVGKRCGALRVRDAEHNWRIMYRIDPDAVLILEVYLPVEKGLHALFPLGRPVEKPRFSTVDGHRIQRCCTLSTACYAKKTQKIPDEVIERCRNRLRRYDEAVKAIQRQSGK